MPFDPLTIVFACVAVLVVWKLHGILGQNTGFQRQRPPAPPETRVANRDAAQPGSSNVVHLPGVAPAPNRARWEPHVESGSAGMPGLDAIASADPAFAAGPFLDGARVAYETIIAAFASGERRTLETLLSPDVYDGFNAALLDRDAKHEILTTTLVSIDDAKILSAALDGRTARVAVRFLSNQISATHGPDGALRSGSPDRVVSMNDVWTFARDVSSRNPNWTLAATTSDH